MTIYCDNSACNYNEDGFCWAEKLDIQSLTCQTSTGMGNSDKSCGTCKYKDTCTNESFCFGSDWEEDKESGND